MRLLWKRHRQTGYTNEDFLKIVQELAGKSVSDWLEQQLAWTEELDYQPFLDTYGLKWKPVDHPKDGPSKEGEPMPATTAHFGLELSNVAGKTQVDKVIRGGCANLAGVQAGDELLAMGGYRVSAEQWSDRVGMMRVGDQTTLLLSRRGKIIELPLSIVREAHLESTPSWNLVRVEKPTEDQEKRWRLWLGLPEETGSETQAAAGSK